MDEFEYNLEFPRRPSETEHLKQRADAFASEFLYNFHPSQLPSFLEMCKDSVNTLLSEKAEKLQAASEQIKSFLLK